MRRISSIFKATRRVVGFVNKHHVISVIALGIFVLGVFVLWVATLRIPDLSSFDERIVQQSTKIYDRTGETVLFDLHEDVQRTIVSYQEISDPIKFATVAIEDTEFYSHNGIRIKSILRAVLANIMSGNPVGGQGGSTITQQVVKNSLLTSEKKISRKVKEWGLAIKLEQVLSKDEILEIYLNEAPYGGAIYGVEQASQSFFGKSAKDVNIAEAAYLAALPQAPTYFSPHGDHTEDLEDRKNNVLERMLDAGFITEKEYESSLKEEVVFLDREFINIRAPHFVFYIQEYIENKYGRKAIEENGLEVITTLDYDLQRKAEQIVLEYALENTDKFNAENAAMVATDPATGQILVMVGSRNYFDEEIDGKFNVSLAKRQPGSSFKPFVYAAALDKGFTPKTIVFDLGTEFSARCSPQSVPLYPGAECYNPQNYDNIFRGPMTFRDALAQSVNIPAVKVLYLVGTDPAIDFARKFGLTTLTERSGYYGLTLVLGGGEVTPLEMSGAYSVFANDGIKNNITGILRVQDGDGNIIEEFTPKPERIIDSSVARQISDILSDNTARTPAFGSNSFLNFPNREVAVKTGTTNDYRDAWIVGYTPSISVATWAGNNDNTSMEKRVAGFIVAPMWNEFMQYVLTKIPDEKFEEAVLPITDEELHPFLRGIWQGGTTYTIDSITGGLATDQTPEETREEKVLPNIHSILHWIDKDNPRGPQPVSPTNDPQYVRWEFPVLEWAIKTGIENLDNDEEDELPSNVDDIHTDENIPNIYVSGISSRKRYEPTEEIEFSLSIESNFDIEKVEMYINDNYVGVIENKPYTFNLSLDRISNLQTRNKLRIVATDSVFNRGETTVRFSVDID